MGILTPLILTSVALANLLIGWCVYRRDTKSATNRSFALLAATISLWTIAVALSHYQRTSHLWNLRLAFSAASFIPFSLLHFVLAVQPRTACAPMLSRGIFLALAVFFSLSSASSWLGASFTPLNNGFRATYGPLHMPFTLYAICGFVYAIGVLVFKLRYADGLQRIQLRYLILALALSCTLATVANLLIPVFLQTSAFSRYGPLSSLLLLALVGHTIVRHRFMDIRVVVKRSAVYLIAATTACLVLISLILATNRILHDDHSIPYREILFALTVAALFAPIKRAVERGMDKYLYREPYNYQRTIREASDLLADKIELDEVLACLVDVVNKALRLEALAIYLRCDDAFDKHLSHPESADGFPASIPPSFPLIVDIASTRKAIFFAETAARHQANGPERLTAQLDQFSIHGVIPLLDEHGLIGLVALGPKQSGEPYYSDDADLLATLANHAAVAIRNALAHQRVVLLNEELMKVLGTIESGVIAVGANRKVSLFNEAAQELTAMAGAGVIGQDVEQVPAAIRAHLEAALRDGTARSQEEFTLPDAAGQRRPLVCSTAPLLSPRGEIVGAVAVLSDLSRLKELEHERRRLDRLGSLESIASGLVHEIRNPLLALKTFSQLMPSRHRDEGFRETFARVTGREIGRIEQLLSRFRTLATTSSQPMSVVDIREPIRNALETLHPQIEEQRVRLRQMIDSTPRPIVGNASQLEQLFLNLCLNALQAMEPGGELTVRVADLSEGGGTTLLVEISDTGCGIPEDLLETIFNPFVTTKPGGTGLGLAICRGIADTHQARLTARNNIERPGCTFTLEFPVHAGDRARARA